MTPADPFRAAVKDARWPVQGRPGIRLAAGPRVAVREFKIASGHGCSEYVHIVERKASGVLEAKPTGYGIDNVKRQVDNSAPYLSAGLNPPVNPLPFPCPHAGVAPHLDHYEVRL
jgi:type I restriction enzyme R subunit